MDGVGRSRRPAGRDRPGLIRKSRRYRVAGTGNGANGLGCCCCRVSAASRARRARRAAIRRRSWARSAARFLTTLRSGFAVVGSMSFRRLFVDDDGRTAERRDQGRGDVAFERRDIRCRPGGCRRGGSGRLRRCRDGGELHFRIGNGRFGFGRRRRSGRCLRACLLCRGFRLCRFDLHRLCRLSAPPVSRARPDERPGFAGRCRGIDGCFRNCGGGAFSAGFSATGGSTRSNASVGGGSSLWRANIGSGVARREGRLANSSCAARNRAAAPRPKIRTDIERTIAVNRKRKPGSMDASSTPSLFWRVIDAKGTR